MPNIKSQKDRVVQSKKEAAHNKAIKSNLKTVVKKADAAIDSNAERDAVVTVQASGFGGCRNPELVEKEWNGSIVTFTVDYYDYEDTAQAGTPYMRKTYQIEFYDGGVYYLSAIRK